MEKSRSVLHVRTDQRAVVMLLARLEARSQASVLDDLILHGVEALGYDHEYVLKASVHEIGSRPNDRDLGRE